jgi:uncharacterized protein (TIGR02231 family)
MPILVEAPIVAVTVYPHRARVTRRGRAEPGGERRLAVTGLPLGLRRDSVRVTASGPAVILGVDVTAQRRARPDTPAIRNLLERERDVRRELDGIVDEEAVDALREDLLGTLSRRSGAAFAKTLAEGIAEPARVAEVGDALADQYAAVLTRRRELAERHAGLADELAAVRRDLEARSAAAEPDQTTVTVELDYVDYAENATEDTSIDLELSYVVEEASWKSQYDMRLHGDAVRMTWYGMVSQQTGEDWPECALTLSTARPVAPTALPDPGPWFLDRRVPPAPPAAQADVPTSYGGAGGGVPELAARNAQLEQGAVAATYRTSGQVAVPSDGGMHRTLITVLNFAARLDYVTAPVLAEEASLRAVVTNGSGHTLLPGPASVFHDNEFVGTTELQALAPGEQAELALGVDDRIRVRRELIRRTASRATLSGHLRREAEYHTTVTNFAPREVTITVLDQVPVSRDENIVVRDVHAAPDPAESTDLGELRWRFRLPPGSRGDVTFGFRVEVAKGVELTGWRE